MLFSLFPRRDTTTVSSTATTTATTTAATTTNLPDASGTALPADSGFFAGLKKRCTPTTPTVPGKGPVSRYFTDFRAWATGLESRVVAGTRAALSPSMHRVNRSNTDFLERPVPTDAGGAGNPDADRFDRPQAFHHGLTPGLMSEVGKRILQIVEHAYLPNTLMALDKFWGGIRQYTDLNPDPVPSTVPEIVARGIDLAAVGSAVNLALQSAAMQNVPLPDLEANGKVGRHDLKAKNYIDKLSWATLSQMRVLPDDEAARQQAIVNGWCQYTNDALAEMSDAFCSESMSAMKDAAGPDGSIPHDHPVWKQLEKRIDRLLKQRDRVINEACKGTLADIGNYPGFTQDSQKLLRSKVARYYRELLASPARATFVLNLANTFLSALPPAGKAAMIIPKALSVIVVQAAAQTMPGRLATTGAYAKLGQMNEAVPNYDPNREYAYRNYEKASKEIAKTMAETIPKKVDKALNDYLNLGQRLRGKVGEDDFPLIYALQAWDTTNGPHLNASEVDCQARLRDPSFWTQQSADEKKEAVLRFLKKYENKIADLPDGLSPDDKLRRLFGMVADRKVDDGVVPGLSQENIKDALAMRTQNGDIAPTAEFLPESRHALLVLGENDVVRAVAALGNNIGELTLQEKTSYGSDEALKALRYTLYGYQAANAALGAATAGAVAVGGTAAATQIGPMGPVLVGAAGVVANYAAGNVLRNLAGEAWSMLAKDAAVKNMIFQQTQPFCEPTATAAVASPTTYTKDPSQQRNGLVKDMISDIVARLETKAAAAEFSLGKQLAYGLHMRYKQPGDSGDDFIKRLRSISDFANAQSTLKVKQPLAALVENQSLRLQQLETAAGPDSSVTSHHAGKARIAELRNGADSAHIEAAFAREGVARLHAEIRSLFEAHVNYIAATPEAFVSQSELDGLAAILNAPSASPEDSDFLRAIEARLHSAGKLQADPRGSGSAPHNDLVPYPDPGGTMRDKAARTWHKAHATSQTCQQRAEELMQNYTHYLSGNLEEMKGYGADLLKKIVTAAPEEISVYARTFKNVENLGVARGGAKWYSSVVGGPVSVGSVLWLSALAAGTAIDMAGVGTPGLANITVGTITDRDNKTKPLRFDVLALCPALLPSAAAVWPEQMASAPAQFGKGNFYLALCKKADKETAGPVFMLINKATGMAAELPTPSREQFADLVKRLEESTKMSAVNPASALYRFKSAYEKQVIAKHPDYQRELKVAQKSTAPHRIREFLKTAFDVRGIRRMLERLHHNESRDAARAELALQLTNQYLAQLSAPNAEDVADIQNTINQALLEIWRHIPEGNVNSAEFSALGDNATPAPRRALRGGAPEGVDIATRSLDGSDDSETEATRL